LLLLCKRGRLLIQLKRALFLFNLVAQVGVNLELRPAALIGCELALFVDV